MRKALKDSTVSFRLPGEVRADLETLAEARDRTMSWLMVEAIREYAARELGEGKGKQSRRA